MFEEDRLSSRYLPSLEGEVTSCRSLLTDFDELNTLEFLWLISFSVTGYIWVPPFGVVWVSLCKYCAFLSFSENSLEMPFRLLGTINCSLVVLTTLVIVLRLTPFLITSFTWCAPLTKASTDWRLSLRCILILESEDTLSLGDSELEREV